MVFGIIIFIFYCIVYVVLFFSFTIYYAIKSFKGDELAVQEYNILI